jgi:hypothetical protein
VPARSAESARDSVSDPRPAIRTERVGSRWGSASTMSRDACWTRVESGRTGSRRMVRGRAGRRAARGGRAAWPTGRCSARAGRHDARGGEATLGLAEGHGVPLGEEALGVAGHVVVAEVAPVGTGAVVGGPMLVEEPHHLVGVAHEVRREVGGDHHLDVERYETPGHGRIEDPGLVPRGGQPDQFGVVTCVAQGRHQVVEVLLGTAGHERHLSAADADLHPGRA